MDRTRGFGLLLWVAAAILVGCAGGEAALDVEDEEAVLEAREALVSGNGTSVNGTSVNGTSVNGTSVNGTSVNGTNVNGTSLNGATLVGTLAGGSLVSGTGFIGATLTSTLSDGRQLVVRVDDVKATPDPQIFQYAVSYQEGATWTSICGYDLLGNPVRAIPLQGLWDYSVGTSHGGSHIDASSMFTFACVGSSLAKCVDLGYKPWASVQECEKPNQCHTVSLADVHAACVRMLRADYCGDGQTHTTNGVPVNLWDSFSIQQRSITGAVWLSEAEWSPGGAVCIKRYRWDPDAAESYVNQHCPERVNAGFGCFGAKSSFLKKYGYDELLATRSVVRNEHDWGFVVQLPFPH